MKKEKVNKIQSVERALNVLELLSESTSSLSVLDISNKLNINRTTIHGLINTLILMDYIRKDDSTGKYTITEKMYSLSYSHPYRLPVVRYASPYIMELSNKYNTMVHVGVLSSENEVLLVKAEFPKDMTGIRSGNQFPLHASGSGKVMLAFMPEQKRDKILKEIVLYPYTRVTITDKGLLLKKLDEIRNNGYGRDEGELFDNTHCISFPIFNSKKEIVATISLSGTKEIIEGNLEQIILDGLQSSKYISRELGWSPI